MAALSDDSNTVYKPNSRSNDTKNISVKKIVKPAAATDKPSPQTTANSTTKKPVITPVQSSSPASVNSDSLPGTILSLTNWKLTLPVATLQNNEPDEISQPQLSTFSIDPYFKINSQKDGVIFRANAGGATTDNSSYPRSELREMTNNGQQRANWSNTSGKHTMTIRQAITSLPTVKPHVVAGQIHDASDDVIMIRLEGTKLFVEGDGNEIGVLDINYVLGTVFTVTIEATNGHIMVSYNGTQKVNYAKSGSGYYFKAGCYTQSNVSKGDSSDAYGEVIVYDLQVQHN